MGTQYIVAQLVVGITFLVAACSKVRDLPSFDRGVAAYGILPPSASKPFSRFLIVAEFLVALTHLSGRYIFLGALTGLALLAVFALAVGIKLTSHDDVNCHCFGAESSEPVTARTLTRVLALAVAEGTTLAGGGVVIDIAAAPNDFALLWMPMTLAILLSVTWILSVRDWAKVVRNFTVGKGAE